MSTRVVLLRHGETDHNATGRMQGRLDVALNARGRGQAARAAATLALREPVRIISSDLVRAAATAQVLATVLGIAVEPEKRLRETDVGEWEGLTHEEVEVGWPGSLAEWSRSADFAPPGGETRTEVAARGHAVLAEQADAGATVVLVAHGGLIAATTALALGVPPPRWPVLGGIGNARWVELATREVDGAPGWRLEGWDVGD